MAYFAKNLKQGIGDPKPEKKEKAKPKPLKRVSEKKKGKDAEYKPLRLEFLKLYPICQYKGCKCKSQDVHHKYSGKDRSKYYLDTDTWMAICRQHHAYIHANPKESREKGYLK